MYVSPRAAPEKPGMPLLGYFVVVGATLTALLFAADAYMPRPGRLSFASNFDGLPADYKGEPSSRRPALAPHIASITPVAETTGSAPASETAAASFSARRAASGGAGDCQASQAQRKVGAQEAAAGRGRRLVRRQRATRNRRWIPRAVWRDSWTSGAFDQAA